MVKIQKRVEAVLAGLNAGQLLAELHATMPPDGVAGYGLLHTCLNDMLAVKMEAYPPF